MATRFVHFGTREECNDIDDSPPTVAYHDELFPVCKHGRIITEEPVFVPDLPSPFGAELNKWRLKSK